MFDPSEILARLERAEARAARAEREVGRLRLVVYVAGLAGLLLMPLGVALAQGGMKVSQLTAPFQVVDGQGRILFQVENARPGPRAQLFGSTGKPIVTLGTHAKGGGTVQVLDRAGKPAFSKP